MQANIMGTATLLKITMQNLLGETKAKRYFRPTPLITMGRKSLQNRILKSILRAEPKRVGGVQFCCYLFGTLTGSANIWATVYVSHIPGGASHWN